MKMNISSIRKCLKIGLAACGLCIGLVGTAQAIPITFDLQDEKNGNFFNTRLTIEDGATDTVRVTADVSTTVNPGITKADILGVFFDFIDTSVFDDLVLGGSGSITSADAETVVNGWSFGGTTTGTNSNNNNVNGRGFSIDLGISLNDNGSSGGFDQIAIFDIQSSGLNANAFLGQNAAARIQSIEGVAGFSSAKTTGTTTGPDPTPIPTPGSLALLLIGGACLVSVRRRSSIHV